MLKLLWASLGLAVLAILPAQAAMLGGSTETLLFGKDPGDQRAFACFSRVYDKAHLAAHPHQNVTDMSLLVDSQFDTDAQSRGYGLTLGVHFRSLKQRFEAYGGCDSSVDGQKLLSCYIDCDGGAIDVRSKDQNSILLDIPDGARVYNPDEPDDVDPGTGVPDKAQFESDDKSFLLQRAALSTCVDLASDDDKKLLLGAAQ